MIPQDKSIKLFLRGGDGVYVIPDGITTDGFRISVEPFEYLGLNSTAAEIWQAVEQALSNTNRVVPHPQRWEWGKPQAWHVKAGARTWGEFQKRAKKIVGLTETNGEYTFIRYYRNRGLFSDKETRLIVPRNQDRDSLIDVFDKYWAQPYNTWLKRSNTMSCESIGKIELSENSRWVGGQLSVTMSCQN